MCERCSEGKKRLIPLAPDERGEAFCEWSEEDSPELCGAEATHALEDWGVESHLCDEHLQEFQRELDAGLGDFLRYAGFQQAADFLPITAEETCDGDLLLRPCSKKATHAKFVLDTVFLCDEHAESW